MSLYSPDFYLEQGGGSRASARLIVPRLVSLFRPGCVVDVGCGTGGWLAEFADLGVEDVLGIDGDWVEPDSLLIPVERFRAGDLRDAITIERRFDMCLCLEVAEHLPSEFAHRLVESLTTLAPLVVFSAAIPGQTGTGHINEQWQSHWAVHFRDAGYRPIDCIRPSVWSEDRVQWWYAQNLIVYVADPLLAVREDLAEMQSRFGDTILDVVHPRLWLSSAASRPERSAGRSALSRIRARLRRRVG